MAISHIDTPPPLSNARIVCVRCPSVALMCLTTPEEGERMYCRTHFLALGEIPTHSAVRPVRLPGRLAGAA